MNTALKPKTDSYFEHAVTRAETDWNACDDGLEWFDENFPADGAEYQEILNKLAEQNESDYAE